MRLASADARARHYARMTERAAKIEEPDLVWDAGAPAPLLVGPSTGACSRLTRPEHLIQGSAYRRVAEFVG